MYCLSIKTTFCQPHSFFSENGLSNFAWSYIQLLAVSGIFVFFSLQNGFGRLSRSKVLGWLIFESLGTFFGENLGAGRTQKNNVAMLRLFIKEGGRAHIRIIFLSGFPAGRHTKSFLSPDQYSTPQTTLFKGKRKDALCRRRTKYQRSQHHLSFSYAVFSAFFPNPRAPPLHSCDKTTYARLWVYEWPEPQENSESSAPIFKAVHRASCRGRQRLRYGRGAT